MCAVESGTTLSGPTQVLSDMLSRHWGRASEDFNKDEPGEWTEQENAVAEGAAGSAQSTDGPMRLAW